ncbi:MAG: signal peptidase I, partial [Acidimicrobiales bacterium]
MSAPSERSGTSLAATDPSPEVPAPEPRPDRAVRRDEPRPLRRLVEWGLVIGGALLVAYLIQLTSLQAFSIPSESMLPTLHKGDRVLVNKWSYRLHDVNRGDVVVFTRPPEVTDTTIDDLIKRVVGLPGDRLTITGGHVEIDGVPLDEPYLPAQTRTDNVGPIACPVEHPCAIPDGQIWVMGDNRINSQD